MIRPANSWLCACKILKGQIETNMVSKANVCKYDCNCNYKKLSNHDSSISYSGKFVSINSPCTFIVSSWDASLCVECFVRVVVIWGALTVRALPRASRRMGSCFLSYSALCWTVTERNHHLRFSQQ